MNDTAIQYVLDQRDLKFRDRLGMYTSLDPPMNAARTLTDEENAMVFSRSRLTCHEPPSELSVLYSRCADLCREEIRCSPPCGRVQCAEEDDTGDEKV